MFPRILLVNNWKHSIPTSTITKANQGHELSRAVTNCHELSRAVPGSPSQRQISLWTVFAVASWTSAGWAELHKACREWQQFVICQQSLLHGTEMCYFSEMNHFKLFEILGKKITWIWGNDGKCLIFAVQGASQWAAQWLVYPSFWRHRLGRENSRWPVAGWTGHVGHQVPGKSSNWWSL